MRYTPRRTARKYRYRDWWLEGALAQQRLATWVRTVAAFRWGSSAGTSAIRKRPSGDAIALAAPRTCSWMGSMSSIIHVYNPARSLAGTSDHRHQIVHAAGVRPLLASAHRAGLASNPGAPNAHACVLGWESERGGSHTVVAWPRVRRRNHVRASWSRRVRS